MAAWIGGNVFDLTAHKRLWLHEILPPDFHNFVYCDPCSFYALTCDTLVSGFIFSLCNVYFDGEISFFLKNLDGENIFFFY